VRKRMKIEDDRSEIEDAPNVPGPERPGRRERLRGTSDRPMRAGRDVDIQ
jgi:hypothetical protein